MREPDMSQDTIHPTLAALPEFTPAPDLWARIRAAHEASVQPQAPRRHNGLRFMAAAAVIAIVAGAIVAMPQRESETVLVEGQRESQTLEREWQALPMASVHPAAGVARLHVIDTALQAAYDRGAQAEELQPLWQQRNDALRGLILSARAEAITRI